ncbi:MAG: HDOD domain-containing protein [Verrucomicrobiota bacterium]|nr:HDOD domain-containing protein [Verrucomicrobiota bacterium]
MIMVVGSGTNVDYHLLRDKLKSNLPTLPAVFDDLSSMLKDPNSPTHSIQEIMRSDPTISMKVLRIANSVQYRGERERVTDVGEAIGTLGFDKIHMVILTSSVFKAFNLKDSKDLNYDPADLWKHSLGTAVASSTIAELTNLVPRQRAYSCGLVHDVGKVARLQVHPEEFCRDVGDALYDETSLIEVEKKNNSPSHDILGQIVCKEWGLNRDVESVIRWHHVYDLEERDSVSDVEINNLIDVVIVGNWLSHTMKFGFSGHRSGKSLPIEVLERLSLEEDQLDFFKEETRESFKDFKNFLKLVERSVI